jgi:hypothetical protein
MPSQVYHIAQRRNNRQDVFFVPDDYTVYLELLKEQSDLYGEFGGHHTHFPLRKTFEATTPLACHA